LFFKLCDLLQKKNSLFHINGEYQKTVLAADEHVIIPTDRQNYLAEIAQTVSRYKDRVSDLAVKASDLGALERLQKRLGVTQAKADEVARDLESEFTEDEISKLRNWDEFVKSYSGKDLVFHVRGREIRQSLTTTSLSHNTIRKVSLPRTMDWGERFKYLKLENVPGEFPFPAGVFQLKRADEDPKRMFAGEGPPERTNKRFHFLTKGETAHRLSTAFDSVTLYGQDPDQRPDIFGKVGESGVNICTLDDMKRLYAGFDLCSPNTSVSMTINGPAPMILAFYFNTAIDQQIEKKKTELGRELNPAEREEVMNWTLQQVRGTVQADILKEDQGQNTCIFSINFALKMMGDIQEYFVQKKIKNFYSVSISGYHIAANRCLQSDRKILTG
jgi:methylmalonyl-CoA mutase